MNEPKQLSVTETAIDGLKIVSLPVHEDSRGWFKENWQRTKMISLGLPDFAPVQNNVSFNTARGTTRGFHAEPWDKYVSVVAGKVFGAWVDLRPGEGFGTLVTAEMDPSTAVFVPRGVANAFQTLNENTVYSYLVTEHWTAAAIERYSYVNLADETLNVPWPIDLSFAIVSEADEYHPRIEHAIPVAPKQILVLGGRGQLGSALARLAGEDSRLVVRSRTEIDITNPADLEQVPWRDYSFVINAAAYTKVDEAQSPTGRKAAWSVNASAVSQLAGYCLAHGVGLVHISTDYVFDGTKPVVTEDEALCPLGVYGESKAAGEVAARLVAQHYIIRTSWVVGDGANFVDTMRRLAHSDVAPLVVDDQIGRLTFAEDLARGILHLIDSDAAFGTYNLQGSGTPTSWYQLARKVFELCGYDADRVGATSTECFAKSRPTFALRPKNSVLDTSKLRATGYRTKDQISALAQYLR